MVAVSAFVRVLVNILRGRDMDAVSKMFLKLFTQIEIYIKVSPHPKYSFLTVYSIFNSCGNLRDIALIVTTYS